MENVKNFIHTLADYIKLLDLNYPVIVGASDESQSLVVRPITGTEVVREYMDGMIEIRMPFEINIKSTNQTEAYQVLNDVLEYVRNVGDFLQDKEDVEQGYVVLGIVIDQIPMLIDSNDENFVYASKLMVNLTII